MQNGKGDSPRPMLNRKQFEETMDSIVWLTEEQREEKKSKKKSKKRSKKSKDAPNKKED